MEQLNTLARDQNILAEYKSVGDVTRLAQKYGVEKMDIYKLIHSHALSVDVANSTEYAQTVMAEGEVLYALPAKVLRTTAGADAIVEALESAIRNSGTDLNVVIAIAVIPAAAPEAKEPFINPRGVAASLQAKTLNAFRKAGA